MVDAIQNYLALVNGLTRMTRQMAVTSARTLLSAAGLEEVANGATERVNKLAEEILLANRANRELVENLVAAEVDKAAARWGFVRNDDVAALRDEVAALRETLNHTAAPSSQQPPLGGTPATSSAPPEHPTLVRSQPLPYEPGPIQPQSERAKVVRPAPVEKAPAKKAPAKKAAVEQAAEKNAPAKKSAPAKKTPVKRAPASKAPANKAAEEQAPPSRANGDVSE